MTFELFLCGVGRGLQRLTAYQATDGKTVVPTVVVGRAQDRIGQVQVVRIVRDCRPTPVVAAITTRSRGRAIEVAREKEIIGEASKAIFYDVDARSTLVATSTAISLGESTIFFSDGTTSGQVPVRWADGSISSF